MLARANGLEDFVLYKTVNGSRSRLISSGGKGGYGVSVPVRPTCHSLRIASKVPASPPPSTASKCSRSKIPFHRGRQAGAMDKADSVTVFDEMTYGETK